MALTRPLLVLLGVSSLTQATTNNCNQCIVTTRRGRVSSQTLVYHMVYDCKDQKIGNCIHNQTQYALCRKGNRTVCYDPKELPSQYWVEIKRNSEVGRLIGTSRVITNLNTSVSVIFDACDIIDDDPDTNCGSLEWRWYYSNQPKYICPGGHQCQINPDYVPSQTARYQSAHLCRRRGWSCVCWDTAGWGYDNQCGNLQASMTRVQTDSNCTTRTCNLVNLTLVNLEIWKQKKVTKIGLKIYGPGEDPGVVINIKIKERIKESVQHRLLFNSFYHEIETGVKYEFPTVAKNLFINLAENIAKSLNTTNCYVCGGTNQGERWPWEAMESNISNPQVCETMKKGNRKQQWVLQTSIIGRSCWQNLKNQRKTSR
ncbi:endogenous retrovirus group 3 member 1 Env polyprotein-like [Falco peregrinus]|uniref:endogenous retrovirus group 3 member 1 Env polyprotein-like n=1 Tax=Falco peregrinus TaxID=8954 RepID=UPI0024787F2D|nr:endogenous retrovirus group 3 member 1 Env polyprotein-like [Falco peregrinus]